MRVGAKRVLEAYLGVYPIKAIYIGTDLVYERNTGEIEYRLSSDGTYAIVLGLGVNATTTIVIADKYKNKPVKEISANAFSGTDITSVTIPATITKIGTSSFANCVKFDNIYFNATNCEDFTSRLYPFSGSSGTVNVGNNVEKIPASMFNNSKITSLKANQEKLKTIGVGAFANCTNLTSVEIGDNVENIGASAFENCPLTSVTIPQNIVSIGNYAFNLCSTAYYYGNPANLINAIYNQSTIYNKFANGATFNIKGLFDSGAPYIFDGTLIVPKNNDSYLSYPARTDIKRLVISKDYKKTIGEGAFAWCKNLEEVYIPLSMKGTENNLFVSLIEEGAFTRADGSTGIQKVYFEGSYEEWEIVSRKDGETYGIGIPYSARIYYNHPTFAYENI